MRKTASMTRNQPFALVYEVERTLYESSSSWEGIDAQEIHLSEGEVVLRVQPGFAAAMPLRLHPATVEISLAHAIEQVEALLHRCLWVIGSSSQPSDLRQRFIALGFTVRMEWEGLTGKNRLRRVMHTYGIAAQRLPQEVCVPWQSNRYHVCAEPVTDAIETMACEVPGSIWQSEGAQTLWGCPDALLALAKRRMSLSMSRDGTPPTMATPNAL